MRPAVRGREGIEVSAAGTVLVVDDNPRVREMARELFTDLGCSVVDAYNAADAISAASQYHGALSLALVDVRMPGAMDGIALAHLLHEAFPSLPIVLTSGERPAGTDSFRFLAKPWRPQDLARLVEPRSRKPPA